MEPRFLEWFCKRQSVWEELQRNSRGIGARRESVSPSTFLSLKIPLPPLSEQKRITARLEELSAKVEEAHGLRRGAEEETEAFYKSMRMNCLYDAQKKYSDDVLKNLISMSSGEGLTSDKLNDSYEYPVYGGGGFVGYYSKYLFEEPKIAIGRVGARCGCIFLTRPKSWITDNALYLTRVSDSLDQQYLIYALSNADLRQEANQAAQPVVSQKKINPIKIPVPPLPEQRRIVAYLDGLQAKVDALKRLQAETASELNAMLPSVLDRAFKRKLVWHTL